MMTRLRFLIHSASLCLLCPTSGAANMKEGNAADAKPQTAAEQLATFTVPEGFAMELVASEETGLPKAAMTAFDDAGRLWSATATEYPRDNEPGIWQQ